MSVDPQAPELVAGDFVAMMNASRMCVLVHDAATKNILWANPAACELLEFTLNEIRPLKANHMSSPARQYDRIIGRDWLQDAVEKGASRIEWHYRAKSGRVIPTDALAVRVELAQGPAVMVQFRDIEREQRVERELRLTTSYVDALAHYTSTLALMLDATGMIRFATDTALSAIGAPVNEQADEPMRPLTAFARLRLDGREASWPDVLTRATPVTPVQLEVCYPHGERVWLEGSLERLREEDGDALLMILHDVSDRVQDQVRRSRELHRENHLARYNAMGDMAMAIAHELGQPLAAAANFLAGVQVEQRGRLQEGITGAVNQIERAAAIVSSVRAFVGHLEQVGQVADLNDIVEECLYFVRLRAAPLGVDVQVRLCPEPVPVRCERVLTGQVVLNLAFNAVDEMAQSPSAAKSIAIATAADGTFTVDDRGRGLPRDPFTESFTSKEHGSGIGLALSYRIITRQHGTIWAAKRDEGGSRFGFALPLAQPGE
ncbi:PAS domain-containing sensor histidine kinase [Nonomuraea guangzhouensis]|uniref:ATP-binding protein n=1 Tax=Nonomuraea guangzhouensis TaxID=1291555 RepID=A0ABW4G903_9ACTN|nr:PAS domain-containing sensor histidine kinase [Nonomuraea guangzhouensis]